MNLILHMGSLGFRYAMCACVYVCDVELGLVLHGVGQGAAEVVREHGMGDLGVKGSHFQVRYMSTLDAYPAFQAPHSP